MRSAALCLVLLLAAAVARAGSGAEAMADAMARMMEAMGLFGGAGGGAAALPGLSAPSGLPPNGLPPNGLPSGGLPQAGAAELGRMLEQVPDSMLRMLPAGAATALEGVWEGRDGGLLVVQGHRFRAQSAQGGYIDGLIQQRGDRIAMYDPVGDSVRAYEFAELEGRLVLRDGAGNVYLYRRLWLGLPDPFAGSDR